MSIRGFVELLRLEQRGITLVSGEIVDADRWSGVAFAIGEHRFVAPMGEVSEVIDFPKYSPVFGVQRWLIGVAQVRGVVIPLTHLAGALGLQLTNKQSLTESNKVIVVKHDEFMTGLVVDKVFGVQHFSKATYTTDRDADSFLTHASIQGAFVRDHFNWHIFMPSQFISEPKYRNPSYV